MTCERAREQLQEQIDGTIDPVIARDLERHLDGCAECRGLAADLAAIADGTAALEPLEAPDHVWLQLAGRWRREQGVVMPHAPAARARRSSFHWLAAAAVLTVAVGGGWIAWRATDTGDVILARAPQAPAAGNASGNALVQGAMDDIKAAEQLYTRAIAGLEQVANEQKGALDPNVAAALDRNLEVIDEAIVESRQAVMTQPESVVARESLFDALRKKVSLL